MKRIKKSAFLTIVMLMAVQIVLGIAYILSNLGQYQTYAESDTLLQVSKTFLVDEYIGILYPLLVAFCSDIERITTIPFLYFIEAIQLVAAFAADYYVVGVVMKRTNNREKQKSIYDKLKKIYVTLFLFTIPFTMQMNLALLPYSLATTSFVVVFGICLSIIKIEKQREYKGGVFEKHPFFRRKCVILALFFTLQSLLYPKYFWLYTLYLIFFFVWFCFQQRKKNSNCSTEQRMVEKKVRHKRIAVLFLTLCIGAGCFQGIYTCTTTPGCYGKIQNSFSAAMVSRFVWPNFATNYYFWSDDIKAVMTLDDAVYICQREDAVEDYFGALVEDAYGRKKANQLYLQMAKRCFMDRTKECLVDIKNDLIDYFFMPSTILRNLQGQGTSENGWNYEKFRSETPKLVKLYCRFSLLSWFVMLIVSFLTYLLEKRKSGIVKSICKNYKARFVLATIFFQTIWLTMSSNYPIDYKLALPIIFCWYLASVSCVLMEKEKIEELQIEENS